MHMDPQVKRLIASMAEAGSPSLDGMSPQQMRAFYLTVGERLGGPSREMADVRDLSAEGPDGPIPMRRYRPHGAVTSPQPGLIYVHGGGWVMGDLDSHDKVCRRLAETCGCIVIAVDYRLAPEHPFPAGPQDVIAASRWIAANAGSLGIDPTRLGIAGDSAGGSLAAVACLANRELPGATLCCQILIYPGTDNSPQGGLRLSRIEQAQTPPMPAEAMRSMVGYFLPEQASAYDWRASPLLARSHSDLPPALIITGGSDPLRDEGIAYTQRLIHAGVDVLHRHFAGQLHGFIEMGGVLDAVEEAMQTMAFWFARCSGAR